MNAAAHAALHRAWLNALLERGDDSQLEDWFSGVHQLHQTLSPSVPRGPDGVRQALAKLRRAFSPWRVVVEDQVSSEQHVMTRVTAMGRHVGPLGVLQPTGGWRVVHGMLLSRVRQGRAYETWLEIDAYRLLQTMKAARPKHDAFTSPDEVDDG